MTKRETAAEAASEELMNIESFRRKHKREQLDRILTAVRRSSAAFVEFPMMPTDDEEVAWWLREIDKAGFDVELGPPREYRLPEDSDPDQETRRTWPSLRIRTEKKPVDETSRRTKNPT